MLDELEILKIVTQRLESAKIEYMVSGSVAMNYYALPRMTRDIDIVIAVHPTDAEKLFNNFKDDFYIDYESVKEAIQQRGAFNVIHLKEVIKVDFIIAKDTEFQLGAFKRKRKVDIDGTKTYFVSKEDLVLFKLLWAKDSRSEMQLKDATNLLKERQDVDMEYIHRWAITLQIEDLLKGVLNAGYK